MTKSDVTFTALILFTMLNQNICFLGVKETNLDKCATYSYEFWSVYKKYFEFVNSLTVSMLFVKDHYQVTKDFTNAILSRMWMSGGINTTIVVKKRLLLSYSAARKRKRFYENNETEPIHPEYNRKYVNKIRRLSSEPSKGHLIIVWDVDTLYTFLKLRTKLVIINPRAVHAIFFVYNIPDVCLDWKKEVYDILVRFWEDHKVLQVIAQIPCSCQPKTVYIYDPFRQMDNETWGYVKEHSLSEIRKNPSLIINSLRHMNQYPLKVSMFVRKPTAITVLPKGLRQNSIYSNASRSKGFGGVDGYVLQVLSKSIDFNVNIYSPDDGENFGNVLQNGTITGSLGDIVKAKVDFSANSRFIDDYNTQEIEFTNTIMGDAICVIVPKSQRIPQWMEIFRCFSLSAWLLILAVYWVCSGIWYYYRPLRANKNIRNSVAYLEVFGIFISQPLNLKPKNSQIFFMGALIIFNVIVVGVFQGSLMTSFTKITYYKEINTLEELEKSNLQIWTSLTVFDRDQTELMKKLSQRRRYVRGNSLAAVARSRNVASLERKRDAKLFIKINYMKDDIPLAHIVEDCPIHFFVAYIVPKGSPYLLMLNYLIEKILESGLPTKWYHDITDSILLEKVFKISKHSEIQRPFNLYDMQTPFFLLALGFFLAFASFICELLHRR